MNIENVTKLRDHLIRLRDGKVKGAPQWNMGMWFAGTKAGNGWHASGMANAAEFNENHWCGTAACMAGHAQFLLAKTGKDYEMRADAFAQQALGLGRLQSEEWFMGHWTRKCIDEITIDDAIDFLAKKLGDPQSAEEGIAL